MVTRDSSPTKRVSESAHANTVLTSAAMWLAGANGASGGDNSVARLNASEVLDSATKWLAAEGVSNQSAFPCEAPKRTSSVSSTSSPRSSKCRKMYDAPPKPESTTLWRPSETRPVSTDEKFAQTVNRISGSPVRSRALISERHSFAPIPDTAPPPPPPRPEQARQISSTEQRPSENTHGSPHSKRKRGRDSSTSIMEGVEGLGQRLKRVCLKAKFHRRARQHVSSEDLTMIGSTEVMPAPITPPDNRETTVYNSPPSGATEMAISSRSLVTGGISSDHEHVAYVSATSQSLVTGIIDKRSEKVKTQTIVVDNMNQPAATAQNAGYMPQTNVFLQPKESGKGVLEDLESDQEILFTESTTSEEEYPA